MTNLNEHFIGTLGWNVQKTTFANVFNDLLVLHARIWLLTKCHYLPHDHTKRPNIGLGREYAVYDGLGRHPPDWQRFLIVRLSVVIIHVDLSSKAEVAQFHCQIVIVDLFVCF